MQAVVAVARELEAENYHDIKRITARKDNVIRLWEYLLELLRARRQRLEMNLGLQKIFQEMLYIMDWMDEMKVKDMPAYRLELTQSGLSLFWAPPTNPQHTVMPRSSRPRTAREGPCHSWEGCWLTR